MIARTIELPDNYSFFLFGARGTGKTTLLRERFGEFPHLYINLLLPHDLNRYSVQPELLSEEIAASSSKWVVIDEVQKLPELLDLAHHHIETSGKLFAMSGSSARKLRHGAANLLAGRAFTRYLFPFTSVELGREFDLLEALAWGTLPKIFEFTERNNKIEFLYSYTNTYLNEEILQEQFIRKLNPFRKFLQLAAQMSGQVLNFSKIAREIGTSVPTVQSYFQILDDTLIGMILPPWQRSVRKRQVGNPKFYLFDTGVLRAYLNQLDVPIIPGTYAFGALFEHFVINEVHRRLSYKVNSFQLSFLRTASGVEIDLIIEQSGRQTVLVEIKSKSQISRQDVRQLEQILSDVPNSRAYCLSRDPKVRQIGNVLCMPWERGINEIAENSI